MKGFKEFLLRGNLIELAVAFIMGTVFAAVVQSFTKIVARRDRPDRRRSAASAGSLSSGSTSADSSPR